MSLPSQVLPCPQHVHLPPCITLVFSLRCSFSRPPSEALSLASWVTGSTDLAGQVHGTEVREHHFGEISGETEASPSDLGNHEGQSDGGITELGGYRVEVGCMFFVFKNFYLCIFFLFF